MNRILAKVGFDAGDQSWKKPPPITLHLEFIYGLLVSDKRHTIQYMHFYSKLDQDILERQKLKRFQNEGVAAQLQSIGAVGEKKLDFLLPRILGTDY